MIANESSQQLCDDHFGGLAAQIRSSALKDAFDKASQMRLPNAIKLERELCSCSRTYNNSYISDLDALKNKFGGKTDEFCAYAQWVMWVCCWSGVCWINRAIENGIVQDSEKSRKQATLEGHLELESKIDAVFNKYFADAFEENAIKLGWIFTNDITPTQLDVLIALKLSWLASAHLKGLEKDQIFGFLADASEAGALISWISAYEAATENSLEDEEVQEKALSSARTVLSSLGAKAKHASANAKRDKARARWLIDKQSYPKKYPSKAAAARKYADEYSVTPETVMRWLKNL